MYKLIGFISSGIFLSSTLIYFLYNSYYKDITNSINTTQDLQVEDKSDILEDKSSQIDSETLIKEMDDFVKKNPERHRWFFV